MALRNHVLLLLALLLLVSGVTLAQPIGQDDEGQWTVPLNAVGYDTFRLNGQFAQREMFIPVPASLEAVELNATLTRSLDIQTGYLEVYSGDTLLTQFSLNPSLHDITIPLTNAEIREGMLPLNFIARLRSADDICTTAYTGAWLDLQSPVLVFQNGTEQPVTVGNFMPALLTRLTLALPAAPTEAEAEAALALAAAVTQRYSGQSPTIVVLANDKIDVNDTTPFERTIAIREQIEEGGIKFEGKHLLLHGTPDQLREQSRFLATSSALAVAPQVEVLTITAPEELGAEVFSFDTLDFTSLQVTGQGRMELPLNFSQSDLGGAVGSINTRVNGSYTPITEGNYGTLSFLFNDVLVKSITLDGSGTFDLYLTLPTELLRRDNTLTARFDYTPEQGQCRLGANSFTGQINGNSTLQITRGEGSLTGFARFPQNSINGFTIAFGTLDANTLTSAVNIVSAMQKTSRTLLQPQVVSWTEATSQSSTALLITDNAEQISSLNPLISLEPMRVVDRQGKGLIELNMQGDLAALQAFKHNGRDVLLAAYRGEGLTALTKALVTDQQGWYSFTGDVALQSGQSQPTMLSLQGSELQTQTLTLQPESLFVQYRFVIFGALVLLVVGFAVLAYPRVVRKNPAA